MKAILKPLILMLALGGIACLGARAQQNTGVMSTDSSAIREQALKDAPPPILGEEANLQPQQMQAYQAGQSKKTDRKEARVERKADRKAERKAYRRNVKANRTKVNTDAPEDVEKGPKREPNEPMPGS